MKQRADWFSWITQFVIGTIAGIFIGLLFCLVGMRGRAMNLFYLNDAFLLIAGTSLATAGLAAYKGDRLWFGKPSIFIPMGHKHSLLSRGLAIVIAASGFLCIVAMLLQAIMRAYDRGL